MCCARKRYPWRVAVAVAPVVVDAPVERHRSPSSGSHRLVSTAGQIDESRRWPGLPSRPRRCCRGAGPCCCHRLDGRKVGGRPGAICRRCHTFVSDPTVYALRYGDGRSASADGARRRRPRRVFSPNHRPQTRRGADHPAGPEVRSVGSPDMVRLVAVSRCLAAFSAPPVVRPTGRQPVATVGIPEARAGVDRRRHGHRPDSRGTRSVRQARTRQHHQDAAGLVVSLPLDATVAADDVTPRWCATAPGSRQAAPTPRSSCSTVCCWSRATTPPTPRPHAGRQGSGRDDERQGRRARATDTMAGSPSGLNGPGIDGYTTPHDLAVIFRAALANPVFAGIRIADGAVPWRRGPGRPDQPGRDAGALPGHARRQDRVHRRRPQDVRQPRSGRATVGGGFDVRPCQGGRPTPGPGDEPAVGFAQDRSVSVGAL